MVSQETEVRILYIGSYRVSSTKTSEKKFGKFRKEEKMIAVYERSKVPEWMRLADPATGFPGERRDAVRNPGAARRLCRTEGSGERRTA